MADPRPLPRTLIAHFEHGPRDGTSTFVLGLESGQPPDILLTPGRPDWVYLLAGGPRADGGLPYTFMSPTRAALVRSRARRVSGHTD